MRPAASGAAAAGDRLCGGGHPPCVVQGPAQKQLDVRVQAPELGRGPSGQGVVDGGIDAQRNLLSLAAHV
jgi:hypothetical protein